MPVKFSSLTEKDLAEATMVVGLWNDPSSSNNTGNCIIKASKFAKQSDFSSEKSKTVHLAGTETITGSKTFSAATTLNGAVTLGSTSTFNNTATFKKNPYLVTGAADTRYFSKMSTYTKGGTVVSATTYAGIKNIDSANAQLGTFYTAALSSGNLRTVMSVNAPIEGNTSSSSIYIDCDSNGTYTTYAPHPVANSNDHNIATTSWVNTKLSGVAHSSGDETISGNKTFSNNIILGSNSTLNATAGTLTAKTQAVTDNSTNVATTAYSHALLRKFFGKTKPSMTELFANTQGQKGGTINLSNDFTNYDMIVMILGDPDGGREDTWYEYMPTWLLNWLLTWAKEGSDACIEFSSTSYYWNVYGYKDGKSTTKKFVTSKNNARVYYIYGVNIDGS